MKRKKSSLRMIEAGGEEEKDFNDYVSCHNDWDCFVFNIHQTPFYLDTYSLSDGEMRAILKIVVLQNAIMQSGDQPFMMSLEYMTSSFESPGEMGSMRGSMYG